MKEIWKKIESFPNYEISNYGNYRRTNSSTTITVSGSNLKPKVMHDGYLLARLSKDKRQFYISLHRLVATAFIPNPESKEEVNHKNLVKHDNNVSNLEWVTPKENIRHARANRVWKCRTYKSGVMIRKTKLSVPGFYPGMTKTKDGKSQYMKWYRKEMANT